MRKLLLALTLFCAAAPAHAQLTSGIVPATKNWQRPGPAGLVNMLQNGKNDWGVWTKSGATVTTSSTNATAPDGTATMTFLKETTAASAAHYMQYAVVNRGTGGVNTVNFRFSCDAEAATRTRIVLFTFNGSGHGSTVVFDLAGGQVGVAQVISGSGGTMTGLGASISPIGVDAKTGKTVYRANMDMAIGAGTSNSLQGSVDLDAGSGTGATNDVYTGDGVSGAYVWQCTLLPLAAYSLVANKLHDDFTTLNTIDVNNTKAPGFKWYVAAWSNAAQSGWANMSPTQAGDLSVSNGILTIANDRSTFGYGIGSACTDGSTGYIGQAFQPPFFYQAATNFNPATAQVSFTSWPDIPMLPTEFLTPGNTATVEFIEWDIMEAQPNGTGTVSMTSNNHDWSASAGGFTGHNDVNGGSTIGSPTLTTTHIYQRLVLDATSAGQGFGESMSFFDGNYVSLSERTWSATTGSSPAATPSNPNGVFSVGDTQHSVAILGTGPSWAHNIDYADVFTKN